MKVGAVVGSITVALVLCSSALAATNPNQQGLSQAQIDQGCTRNGRYVSCPSQMQRVEVAPMQRVEATPIRRVEAAPIRRVEAAPVQRNRPAQQTQSQPNTQVQANQRGKVIDPKGQGLNQAQINAMEQQRRLMWNATGGGMVYR